MKTTRLIGSVCKRREAFSLRVLIGRGLDLLSSPVFPFFPHCFSVFPSYFFFPFLITPHFVPFSFSFPSLPLRCSVFKASAQCPFTEWMGTAYVSAIRESPTCLHVLFFLFQQRTPDKRHKSPLFSFPYISCVPHTLHSRYLLR